jgi:hypothetical protein
MAKFQNLSDYWRIKSKFQIQYVDLIPQSASGGKRPNRYYDIEFFICWIVFRLADWKIISLKRFFKISLQQCNSNHLQISSDKILKKSKKIKIAILPFCL